MVNASSEMAIDWNIVSSVITSIASILALAISVYQIRLSNKHQLFERRMVAYMQVKAILSACKDAFEYLPYDDEPDKCNALFFRLLASTTSVEEYAKAIEHPWVEPDHRRFINACEHLEEQALAFQLIFKGRKCNDNTVKPVVDFIMAYQSTLLSTYRYEAILHGLRIKSSLIPEEAHYLSKDECQNDANQNIENLKGSYNAVVKLGAEEKIRKQLSII